MGESRKNSVRKTVLAIGAHFDDLELGCGGTLSRHISAGDKVIAYVATKSGYSNSEGKTIRSNAVASAEGIAGLQSLGIFDIVLGSHKTFCLEFNEDLNTDLLELVQGNKIDVVYTHWDHDIHHDHRALALSTLHVCRHIPTILMYRSNWYESSEVFEGKCFVDVSNFWENKVRAVEAHKSELERVGRSWLDFVTVQGRSAGRIIGVQYAEQFKVVKLLYEG